MSHKAQDRADSLLDTPITKDPEAVRSAQLVVAALARDNDDCLLLLTALGIEERP